MLKFALIFLGAGLGGTSRYLLGSAIQSLSGPTFPIGTIAVNTLGCLAVGFLTAVFAGPLPIREEYRLGIMVGFLGGFTTFSAFGRETFDLASDRQYLLAALNVLLSNCLGLAGVWLGARLAARLYTA